MPEEAAPDCENYKGGHCMSNTNQYDVVWPLTPSTVQGAKLAKRPVSYTHLTLPTN